MELTQEEIELVLNFRKEKESGKIIKIGMLKHDLYYVDHFDKPYDLLTKEMRSDLIEKFKNSFAVAIKRGTKFVCRKKYNFEEWYEVEGEDEQVWDDMPKDEKWAEEHLENIEVL